jgi:hypothetical protein
MNTLWIMIAICLLAVSTDIIDWVIDNWFNYKK